MVIAPDRGMTIVSDQFRKMLSNGYISGREEEKEEKNSRNEGVTSKYTMRHKYETEVPLPTGFPMYLQIFYVCTRSLKTLNVHARVYDNL